MKRSGGGMITIQDKGTHHLLVIGGIGSPPTLQLPGAQYHQIPSGHMCTNEQNMYNLSTGKCNDILMLSELSYSLV